MALGRPAVVAAYVIRGKESALIDMGYVSSAGTVLKDLKKIGLTGECVDYLSLHMFTWTIRGRASCCLRSRRHPSSSKGPTPPHRSR
jgi:hypothetical protein